MRANLEQALNSYSGAVVFGAEWCDPCKGHDANIEEAITYLPSLRNRVLHLDVDLHPELAERFGVKALPTTVILAYGKEARRSEGEMTPRAFWSLYFRGERTWPEDVSAQTGPPAAPAYTAVCPCGCNGQCNGQCNSPNCTCRPVAAAPPKVASEPRYEMRRVKVCVNGRCHYEWRRVQVSGASTSSTTVKKSSPSSDVSLTSSEANFRIAGVRAGSASYSPVYNHATRAHGRNVRGQSRNQIIKTLVADHRRGFRHRR